MRTVEAIRAMLCRIADRIGGALLALGSFRHESSIAYIGIVWEGNMPRLKSLGYGLALVFAASVGPPTLVRAATTDLFCHESGTNRTDGLNLSIDVSARTATAWTTGSARSDVPALPATVTADQVIWSADTSIGTFHYTLDRNSGVLTVLGPNRTGGIIPTTDSWSCAKATPVL